MESISEKGRKSPRFVLNIVAYTKHPDRYCRGVFRSIGTMYITPTLQTLVFVFGRWISASYTQSINGILVFIAHMSVTKKTPKVSVVFPCRNEEKSLGVCIKKVQNYFKTSQIDGEIIVSDSSTDSSPDIARSHKVVLVKHDKEGYGRAYLEGFAYAHGEYVVCADPDGSYAMEDIHLLVEQLEKGSDMVLGNRFSGNMNKDSMPFINRYIGNPILSGLFRIFFRVPYRDIHCGLRAFRRSALEKMELRTTGMEFASEMVFEAIRTKALISEVPVHYLKRSGRSKLRPVSDAWRHIRFMLLYSPTYLFLLPGLFLFVLGTVGLLWFSFSEKVTVFGFNLYVHPIFVASLLTIVGVQTISFAFFAKTYAVTHFSIESRMLTYLHKHITLERGLSIGVVFLFLGLGIFSWILYTWVQQGFPNLQKIQIATLALTSSVVGIQIIFSSFMLSLLGIRKRS